MKRRDSIKALIGMAATSALASASTVPDFLSQEPKQLDADDVPISSNPGLPEVGVITLTAVDGTVHTIGKIVVSGHDGGWKTYNTVVDEPKLAKLLATNCRIHVGLKGNYGDVHLEVPVIEAHELDPSTE